ncbi:MAG: ATP-binding cassette domain-containing protein [Planctomycetota bacterium]
MAEPAIELRGVAFRYQGPGGFRLHVDRFDAQPGEVVACVGPSGSGKTTLLDLLAGRRVPGEGAVRVASADLGRLDLAGRRRVRLTRLGIITQSLSLVAHLTALENILLPAILMGRTPRPHARAHELAGALEIGHLLGRRPKRLSQGERQRVAVARGLLLEPLVVLADEPTGHLDAARSALVIDLLRMHADSHAACVFLATHDQDVVSAADRSFDVRELTSEPIGDSA